jgi:hypothetical protein
METYGELGCVIHVERGKDGNTIIVMEQKDKPPMRKAGIILSVFALFVGACGQSLYAQFKIPAEYSEYMEKRIYVDFDEDGKKDTATIIAQNDSNYYQLTKYAFLIYLTGDNKNHIVEFPEFAAFPLDLEVENNVIQFGYVQGGSGRYAPVFRIRYNHTERKIQLIDFEWSYRITGIGGNHERNFNLLTGDYRVTDSYNEYNYQTGDYLGNRTVSWTGNKKLPSIFIEDINDELIDKLLSISDNDENYLVEENGVDIFLIGEQIPFELIRARNYTAEEDIEYERYETEIDIFRIYENEQKVFTLEWFFSNTGREYIVSGIRAHSNKFKTAEGVGVGSSIEDVTRAYPDSRIIYSQYDAAFWIETPQNRFRFYLNEKDLMEDTDYEREPYESLTYILQPSDFKENSKITEVRIR